MLSNLIVRHGFGGEVFAETRLFETTVRCFGGQRNVIVDPDGAIFQLRSQTHRTAHILGKDRGRQPIGYIIAVEDCFLFRLKCIDRNHRSEDFALDDF